MMSLPHTQQLFRLVALMLLLIGSWPASALLVHHNLDVEIDPDKHRIEVTDHVRLPTDTVIDRYRFRLNSNLKAEIIGSGKLEIVVQSQAPGDVGMDRDAEAGTATLSTNEYLISNIEGNSFTLRYEGQINYPLQKSGGEYARGFSQSPGIISKEGVYLAGSSYWVPTADGDLLTYKMSIRLPQAWRSVAQGKQADTNTWKVDNPTEEIHLIAAEFWFREKLEGQVRVQVYLRSEDPALAEKYMGVTGQYLEMYSKLIGPYPYSKFALVENFWETGYGMPSFTLLGSKVIRFPFILHSSYPHELLHNWWGNGVYVDFSQGNWCEGLTTNMADHLVAEQRGKGSSYRRTALQAFGDYVTPENDFPLSAFRSRHDAASSAIGYNKAAMLFEMLRDQAGDDAFRKSLSRFYRENLFKRAGYKQIAAAFQQETGKNWAPFFDQWVQRRGAPKLSLGDTSLQQIQSGQYELKFVLEQSQPGEPFDLQVPVVVQFDDHSKRQHLHLKQPKAAFVLRFEQKPGKLLIDPQFNLFRQLHPEEIPSSLSQLFGAGNPLVILPSRAGAKVLSQYKQLTNIWSKDKPLETVVDTQLEQLPANRAIWVMGRQNLFSHILTDTLAPMISGLSEGSINIAGKQYDLADHSLVLTTRNPRNSGTTVGFLHIHSPDATNGLARKLPHYGKYSYLAFSGAAPDNQLKGSWPASGSPMEHAFGKGKVLAQIPDREALASLPSPIERDTMMEDIGFFASPGLEGRAPGSRGIGKAAEHIIGILQAAGLTPAGDHDSWQQTFTLDGPTGKPVTTSNIVGLLPGTDKALEKAPLVISAHYDHLGFGWPDVRKGNKGKIHPGADDNASGVAVLLELARQLARTPFKRPVVFLFTSAEEAGLKGARYFISNNQRWPDIMANVNLDTVGRLEGRKLMIFGAGSAREWPFIFMGIGAITGIQSELISKKLDASDNVAFAEEGIPAVQIFSGIHLDYHKPSDSIDKIDADGLVKVVRVTREIIDYLAQRSEPLHHNNTEKPAAHEENKGSRKVSTGVVPDFSYKESGVRIQEIVPGSPVEKAGLQAGDIIKAVDGHPVTDLKSYADILKSMAPEQAIYIDVLRQDTVRQYKVILQSR